MERNKNSKNGRLITTALETLVVSVALWATYTDRTQPPILPTISPTAAAPRDIPTFPTRLPAPVRAPTPELKLTDQELNTAAIQIEDTRIVINEFVSNPFLRKYGSTALKDLPRLPDPSYKQALEKWAREPKKNIAGGITYFLATGPADGVLVYQISNAYDQSGRNTASSLLINLAPDVKNTMPELREFYGRETVQTPNGKEVPLLTVPSRLTALAETLFSLPEGIVWKQTTGKFEGGEMVPAAEGQFVSNIGPASVYIDATGIAIIAVHHN